MNSAEQVSQEIQTRISTLAGLEGDNLRAEMYSLRETLLANPSACELLFPVDIGQLVAAQRKILGISIASAATAKTKSTKGSSSSKALSKAELAKRMAEVNEDDLL